MKKTGIYIHIPFCLSKCDYCNFVSVTDYSLVDDYISALITQIERASIAPADTIYIGGGTPSSLSLFHLEKVINAAFRCLPISLREFSIECNPDTVDEEKMKGYADMGINRISLGVQSFSDSILKGIGRRHDSASAKKAIEIARRHFDNVSIDFMLNLPSQEMSDIDDLSSVVTQLQIPHVSCYGLKIEEGTPLFESKLSLDEDYAASLYEYAASSLQSRGIMRYEISNFAKNGFSCLHNEKYWSLAPYIGFGCGAHSFLEGKRIANEQSVEAYCMGKYEQTEQEVSKEDLQFEYIMLTLRTAKGVHLHEFETMFKVNFLHKYKDVLRKYAPYFVITDENVVVSDAGVYTINSLLINFL